MQENDRGKKRLLLYAALLALCITLTVLLQSLQPLHSHAATWEEMAENGTVRDGAVGDRPGYIGDENRTDPHDQNHTGLTGDLPGDMSGNTHNEGNRQAVLGARDSMPNTADSTAPNGTTDSSVGTDMTDSAMSTFWWVLAAIVIAAIVLAIVWLLLPKREEK